MSTPRLRVYDDPLGYGRRLLASRATPDASGFDLPLYEGRATLWEPWTVYRVKTGVSLEIPAGYEGQVRPRSWASAAGIHVTLGTIDRDFRGEIVVVTWRLPDAPCVLERPFAQIVIVPVFTPTQEAGTVELVAALSETPRGVRGFGSSDAPAGTW